jgi:hypothetical protein
MTNDTDLREHCRTLVLWLLRDQAPIDGPVPLHAAEVRARLADHLLTTAALVCCLAPEHPHRDVLRLTALTHDLPAAARARWLGDYAASVQPWLELLAQQGARLDDGDLPALPATLDDAARVLLLAHLAASRRHPPGDHHALDTHPLAGAGTIDLVYGGATRVKSYVFESARLPEIRGASVLLDHLNRLDVPAFWGQTPPFTFDLLPGATTDAALARAQQQRHDAARAWFAQQMGRAPLDAPECVLYASSDSSISAPRAPTSATSGVGPSNATGPTCATTRTSQTMPGRAPGTPG